MTNEPAVPGYYTVAELASASGRSRSAIRWHCQHGQLRDDAKATGREWLIPDGAGNRFIIWALARRAGS